MKTNDKIKIAVIGAALLMAGSYQYPESGNVQLSRAAWKFKDRYKSKAKRRHRRATRAQRYHQLRSKKR